MKLLGNSKFGSIQSLAVAIASAGWLLAVEIKPGAPDTLPTKSAETEAAPTAPLQHPAMRKTNPQMRQQVESEPGQLNPILPGTGEINEREAQRGTSGGPHGEGPPDRPTPLLERKYKVGRIFVKYGTGVQTRNPILPTEKSLEATVVPLLRSSARGRNALYHTPTSKPNDQRPDKKKRDPALYPEVQTVEPLNASSLAGAAGNRSPNPAEKAQPKGHPGRLGEKVSDAKTRANEAGISGKASSKRTEKSAPKLGTPTGGEGEQIVNVKVSDFGEPQDVSAMALIDVYDAIVDRLTDRGLIGVYLKASIDPRLGDDKRNGALDIQIQVFVSEVAKVRTIARRLPFRLGDLPKINDDEAPDGVAIKDPKHQWIKTKSPVFIAGQKAGGGLLDKRRLQEYLSRLNRFPGRRVDAAINASEKPGEVILDYLIREQKPWTAYIQTANSGTKATGEWRSRVGGEIRQLANMDDILRLEYITTDLDRFNSGILSYQLALVKPDVLKMRVYGLYGSYSAQDVGFAGANFKGDSLTAGAALIWTPLYWHGFPLDISLGAEFLRASVDNGTTLDKATANFILPYVGIGTERVTDRFSLAANLQLKGSFDSPDQNTLNGLGRFDTNGNFFMIDGEVEGSVFLEPLIFGKKWGDLGPNKDKWWRGMMANELSVSAHGQYVLGNQRVVPQLEFIAGGTNTVRGYPESFSAGDSGVVARFEYRLHVPRLFKPSDAMGKPQVAKKKGGSLKKGEDPTKPSQPSQPPAVESALPEPGESAASAGSFRLRPPSAGSGADWDLIFRGFTDFGQTYNNRGQASLEADRTLLSVGAGLELQIFKPILQIFKPVDQDSTRPADQAYKRIDRILPPYLSVRVDYGVVINGQSALLLNPVNSGDARLHISGTIAW